MSKRYFVYTLRRTAARTVYAIYDNELGRPIADGARLASGAPWTTTIRENAASMARSLNSGVVSEPTRTAEQEIEAHNRATMWVDAANHLVVAVEALDHAQSVLDDLGVPHISENLTPHVEAICRFRDLADERGLSCE